jgi:branched-chain amino acid transport system substrate-binding protein
MARRSRRILFCGLAAAALTVAAGCSSSSSSSSSTSAAGTTAGATTGSTGSAATGSVIKIGYMVSLSGPQASSTTAALPTAQAWAKWVNANGGINGHQVEIVSADSMGTATGGQSAVNTLLQKDNVDAIMLSDPIAEYSVYQGLAKDNIAVLDGSGYGPFWHQTPNFFDTSTDSTATESSSVPAGKAAGSTTMAIAACSEVASCAQSAQEIVPSVEKAGMKSAGVVTVASTATDYTAQCLAFSQRKADYVYMAIAPAGAAHMMAGCIQQGYKGLFGTNATSFDPSLYGTVKGMTMVGTINGFPWWSGNSAVADFRNVMTKYAPGTKYQTSQATATWASLQLLAKGLTTTKPSAISQASVLAAMYSIKDETLGGLLPQPVTYTAGKASAPVNCFWQFKFVAGQQDPTTIAPTGESGNNASGDLATACLAASS